MTLSRNSPAPLPPGCATGPSRGRSRAGRVIHGGRKRVVALASARLEDADKVGTSICPYCAVGCAQLAYAKGNDIIHIEGDPRSPINQGTLCPKGAATIGWIHSPKRLTTVKHRKPGSDHWDEVPLDWAMERIAQLIKQTRDETFEDQTAGRPLVNRTLAIASLGGATLDNEENYLIKKLFGGGLGVVWIENQARV